MTSLRLLPLIAAASVSAPVLAAPDPITEQGFSFRLGGFYSDASTNVRIDSSGGNLGTSISLEGDLGFEANKWLPTIDAAWRINPRHRVELSYLRLARDSRKTISGEIHWGDATFPINSEVNAQFDSDVWRLAYGYSFYRDGPNEMSVVIGAHVTAFKTAISNSGGQISEKADRTLPLPTIGLQGAWTPAGSQWRVSGSVNYFALEYGDYDGSLVNATASAEYRFAPNWAVGAGYTTNQYKVDVTKGELRGKFDYTFSGPLLYVTGGF
jgi:hypothetical protein